MNVLYIAYYFSTVYLVFLMDNQVSFVPSAVHFSVGLNPVSMKLFSGGDSSSSKQHYYVQT